MPRTYKTAQGLSLDMDSLRLNNEETIAVGNMKVNARGDQLGPGGRIVKNRNQVMDQHYKLHTPMVSKPDNGAAAKSARPESGNELDPDGFSFDE